MIARRWHGRVPAAKADAYYDYLLETGLRDYRSTPGNRGVLVERWVEKDVAHFALTTALGFARRYQAVCRRSVRGSALLCSR